MLGVELSDFKDPLHKVPAHRAHYPLRTFDAMERIGPTFRQYIHAYFGEDASFEKVAHSLPLEAFGQLSFDELCKIRYSTRTTMDESVQKRFTTDPRYIIVNKIHNSMWRWGFRRGTWNEIVDAYDGIRRFHLDLPGFDVRLDHTTGHNECGYSEHSRTFLDGVFAFLVHYRGEHVMTVGFSITNRRRLLIQQVQLAKQRGNRFLFRMPKNRIEFILDRFKAAFPRHQLYLVDGSDVAKKSMRSYRDGIQVLNERIERALQWKNGEEDLQRYNEQRKDLTAKLKHLKADSSRLKSFYADAGRYPLGEPLRALELTHYAVG